MTTLGAGYYSISGRPYVVDAECVISFSRRVYTEYESEQAFMAKFPDYGKEEEDVE